VLPPPCARSSTARHKPASRSSNPDPGAASSCAVAELRAPDTHAYDQPRQGPGLRSERARSRRPRSAFQSTPPRRCGQIVQIVDEQARPPQPDHGERVSSPIRRPGSETGRTQRIAATRATPRGFQRRVRRGMAAQAQSQPPEDGTPHHDAGLITPSSTALSTAYFCSAPPSFLFSRS